VPSVSRSRQLAVLALGGTLATAGLAGCATTQEKATAQRAESARILKARDRRQQARKNDNRHADGPKRGSYRAKSARRQEGSDE
jgi:hypothetical protein